MNGHGSLLRTSLVLIAAAALTGGTRAQRPRTDSHGVTIRDAWVRASTALRTSSSGYGVIENATAGPVALVSISAPGVAEAQLHTMMADSGQQMEMHPVSKLMVPAGGKVELAPGGTHIMLTGIAQPLQTGGTLELTFTFDNGRSEKVRAVVRPLGATGVR